MLSIGEFASIGRVTVRMLRHYDQIGLLRPASVDPHSGYRSYRRDQLPALALIVQLRSFGLGLDDINGIVGGAADPAEIRAVLERARTAQRAVVATEDARLARLEAYLRPNEGEVVSTITAEIRAVEPVRVATLTKTAAGFGNENIGPVVGPMFPEVAAALEAAGIASYDPAIAFYEADPAGDGSGVLVTAGFTVPDRVQDVAGLDINELPAIAQAAVTTHRGDMTGIGGSWEALIEWARERGYELSGACREVYLTPGDRPQSEWVTELVQPVTAR